MKSCFNWHSEASSPIWVASLMFFRNIAMININSMFGKIILYLFTVTGLQSLPCNKVFCLHHSHALSSVYPWKEPECLRFISLVYASAEASLFKKYLGEFAWGHFQKSQVWYIIMLQHVYNIHQHQLYRCNEQTSLRPSCSVEVLFYRFYSWS